MASVIGCSYAVSPVHARAGEKITIFAAASLKEALDAVVAARASDTGEKVTISYAGSNTLARQIEAGAPADIFISADLQWMTYLRQRNLVREPTVSNLLLNRLVVIAPASSPGALDPRSPVAWLTRLAGGRLATGNTDGVPAGIYARAALQNLRLWETLRGSLAQADNVRMALAYVARGEAPLGIVYATDASAEPRVAVVARLPQGSHPPIVYPAAVLNGARHPGAEAYLTYLKSPGAQAIFAKFGFDLPGKPGT